MESGHEIHCCHGSLQNCQPNTPRAAWTGILQDRGRMLLSGGSLPKSEVAECANVASTVATFFLYLVPEQRREGFCKSAGRSVVVDLI